MNRLFSQDGKCLQVALDHGAVNVARFLTGIEDLQQVIVIIAAATSRREPANHRAGPLASGPEAEPQTGLGDSGGFPQRLLCSDAKSGFLQND